MRHHPFVGDPFSVHCRYATVTLACSKLLLCVPLPATAAGSRYLFRQGSVECHYLGWQLPLILAVSLLVVVPLVLPALAAWSLRRTPTRYRYVRIGVRLAIVESYHKGWYWWESMLLVQRLVLVLVYTFGSSDPGGQALVLTTLCILYLVLHATAQPLRRPESQGLQLVLLVCLCVRGLVGALQEGVALAGGVVQPGGARPLGLVFSVVVPMLAGVWAYGGPHIRWPPRWAAQWTRQFGGRRGGSIKSV